MHFELRTAYPWILFWSLTITALFPHLSLFSLLLHLLFYLMEVSHGVCFSRKVPCVILLYPPMNAFLLIAWLYGLSLQLLALHPHQIGKPQPWNYANCSLPMGLPGGSVVRNLPCQAGNSRLIPGSGRCPGGRNGTPVFLPGKSHGQRSLVGYSPRGHRVGHYFETTPPLLPSCPCSSVGLHPFEENCALAGW